MFQFSKRAITAEQKQFWDENGYLILENAMPAEEADRVRAIVDELWETRHDQEFMIDLLSGEHSGSSHRLRDVGSDARGLVYKINSLFGPLPEVRKIAYTPTVRAAVTELLDGEPLICASLNLERGSQQTYHFDTWYMPPPPRTGWLPPISRSKMSMTQMAQ